MRNPRAYIMMMIAFTLFIIGYSLWAIYQAMNLYDANDMSSFYVYGFMGILGLVLGLFSLAQLRRRMQPPPGGIAPKVTSVVLCSNCGFKVIRAFATGDFIRKEAGKCQQCTAGTMYIDSIYAEETKKQ